MQISHSTGLGSFEALTWSSMRPDSPSESGSAIIYASIVQSKCLGRLYERTIPGADRNGGATVRAAVLVGQRGDRSDHDQRRRSRSTDRDH